MKINGQSSPSNLNKQSIEHYQSLLQPKTTTPKVTAPETGISKVEFKPVDINQVVENIRIPEIQSNPANTNDKYNINFSSKETIATRMDDLKQKMNDVDSQLRKIGKTPLERNELTKQYVNYKNEYNALNNSLPKTTTLIANDTIGKNGDQFNSTLQAAPKSTLSNKLANFTHNTLPTMVEKTVDAIKEPITGPSLSKLMTEAKLSPKLLKEDAEIQLAKDNPTKEDYAMVKQTKKAVEKFGMSNSKINAMGGNNTDLYNALERAENTYQVSPIKATAANIAAGGSGVLGDAANFANMLGADKVPILKDITNAVISTSEVLQENAQKYNMGDYGNYLGNLTQVVTRMAPYALLGGGKAVTKYGSKANAVMTVLQNPSFWVSLTTEAGRKYGENTETGYGRGKSTLNALLYAVPAALIEIGGGLGSEGAETESMIKTIISECWEEISQDMLEGAVDKATLDHSIPIFSNTDDRAIINLNKMKDDIIYTAPATILTGGAGKIRNAKANYLNPIQYNKVLQQMDQDVKTYKKNSAYSPLFAPVAQKNLKINSNQIKGLENSISKKTEALNQATNVSNEQTNKTIPKEVKTSQNANTEAVEQNARKSQLENEINANKYLSNEEKSNLINALGGNDVTIETETALREILDNVNKSFETPTEENKYKKYLKDKTELDKNIVDMAKNSVAPNKSGRRTKEQWINVANNLGKQIYNMSDAEVERYAYKTWQELHPNQAANLNRQGQRYVKFTSDEWINAVKKSAVEAKQRTSLPTQAEQLSKLETKADKEISEGYKRISKRLNMEIEQVDNLPENVNGYINGDKIILNKNSKQTGNTIFAHELTHRIETSQLKETILNSNAFNNYIEDQGMSIEEFREHIDNLYNGVEHNTDSEMIAKFVEENMFKDEKSINRLADENPTLLQKFKDWIDDLVVKFTGTQEEVELRKIQKMYKEAIEQAKTTANNQTALSIENIPGTNKRYVKADRQVISGNNPLIWEEQVENYINDKIRNNTDVNILTEDGEILTITKDTAGKAKFRNDIVDVKGNRRKLNDKEFATKLRAETHIDELAETSKFKNGPVPDSKNHNFAKDGFTYRTGYFEDVDGKYYKVTMSVGKNGEINTIYNIGRMDSAQKNRNNSNSGLKGPSGRTTSNRIASTNSISENTNLVNNKNNADNKSAFSISETKDNKGRTLSKEQQEYLKEVSDKIKDENGNVKRFYHGTKRADRVGNMFDPKKATSGPMAYFTDSQEVATNYSRDKSDTSLSREFDTEKDLFKVGGKTLDEYWQSLTPKERQEINNKAKNVGFDDDWENVIYNPNTDSFGGQYEYYLKRETSNNGIDALYKVFIEDGNLFGENIGEFKKALELAGVKGVEYLDPYKTDEKVYEVYLNLKNPFDTSEIGSRFVEELKEASKNATIGEQYSADLWDKSNITPEAWIEKLEQDQKNGTTHAWTVIPDWVTDVLKSKGYDGIVDAGGKGGGQDHQVAIPFYSNQIKNIDNIKPTSNEDIRYSVSDDISKLNKEYGTIKQGEKSERDIKLPKQTGKNQYLSQYARTLAEAGVTTEQSLNLIEKDVVEGRLSHEVVSDKSALEWAENYIKDNGWQESAKNWDSWIKGDHALSKNELALGQLIYNNAVQAKDTQRVQKMIGDLVAEFSESGRNLQAARLIKKMTPDGRLYALERSVQKINQELLQRTDKAVKELKKDGGIKIPEELAKNLLESKNAKEIDKAVSDIQQYIADQMPPTWLDKLNAWRYTAMLGNPRTHVRNIGGNALMVPVKNLKNEIATIMEKTLPQEQRTKSVLNPFSKSDNALKDFARNDFDANAETVRGESKYDVKAGIKEKQRIFNAKPLENLRKANFNALEAEDAFFLKMHYTEAFAEAMKAKGITPQQARTNTAEMNKIMSDIRTIAINEAQKATYRDANAFAQAISRAKQGAKLRATNAENIGGKVGWSAANLVMEGALPFAKTPANIVRRGIEYSPIGLLKGIGDATLNVKNGKVTASQAIDEISSGLSGTGIVALGMLLARLGLVTGGDNEDDKEQYFEEMTGLQNYALKLGKYNYTIDWSAPASMPLFVGVELYNMSQQEDMDFEKVLGATTKIAEPVFELSMLQGINSTIKSAAYSNNPVGSIVGNTATGYLSQYNPTVLGQLARTIDDTRRVTYEDKNKSFSATRKFGQKQLQKIPILNQTLLPKYDQFGRKDVDTNIARRAFENFISPGYISEDKTTPVELELKKVYKETGDRTVLPSYAAKNITVNKEKINFTQKQYETFTVERGQTAYDQLDKMFKDGTYQKLSYEDKKELIADVYTYATNYAKTKVSDAELSTKYKKMQKAEKEQGIAPYYYMMILQAADTNNNNSISQSEFDASTKKSNLTQAQKAYLIALNKEKNK